MTVKKNDEDKPQKITADPKVLQHISTLFDAVDIFNQKLQRLHPADLARDEESLRNLIEGVTLFRNVLEALHEYAKRQKPLKGVRTLTVREALALTRRPDDLDDDISDDEWEELNRDPTPEEWERWESECDEQEARERGAQKGEVKA